MSAHLRRLQADERMMCAAFAAHPFIRVIAAEGTPPEKYTVEFTVKSLVPGTGSEPAIGQRHRAEIFLPLDYPRRPPFCRMITPVFHPNIDPQKICIGDHWSAGQSLSHLVVRIGEMLCGQSYNTKSPLNAEAAAWAQQHLERLPLQHDDLMSGV
jgi:ubiquitin-protein ligase